MLEAAGAPLTLTTSMKDPINRGPNVNTQSILLALIGTRKNASLIVGEKPHMCRYMQYLYSSLCSHD